MNIRRTAVQVTNYEEAIKLMEKVDFSPLNKIVSDLVGMDITFQYKVREEAEGHHPVVTIFSDTDVKEKTGFLKDCFEKVLMRDFGATLYEVYEFDQDLIDKCVAENDWDGAKKVPQTFIFSYLDLYLDARIFLRNGGSNGLHVLSARFDFETGEWKF